MQRKRLIAVIGFVLPTLAAVACSGVREPIEPHQQLLNEGGGALGLPCDVDDVLERNCRDCHSDPPNGAPMPLVTYAHTQADSSDPDRKVWEMMDVRVNAGTMPPAYYGELDDPDLAVLNAWFDAGAPPGDCGGGGSGGGGGAPPRPCEPDMTFTAFDSAPGDAGFHVPEAIGNHHQCFVYDVPFGAEQESVAFLPEIDEERVVHHMVLYSSDVLPVERSFDCDEGMPEGVNFLAGWAPGQDGIIPPDDVSIELPDSGYLILEMHYYNLGVAEQDASGLGVCVINEPRDNTAAFVRLGTRDIHIPCETTGHDEVAECNVPKGGLNIIGTVPHMHNAGASFVTDIVHEGGDSDELIRIDDWDFGYQAYYDASATLLKGDTLKTTCTYDNLTSEPIHFGEGSEEEMCFNFVLVYPASGLKGARSCVEPGGPPPPMKVCDQN